MKNMLILIVGGYLSFYVGSSFGVLWGVLSFIFAMGMLEGNEVSAASNNDNDSAVIGGAGSSVGINSSDDFDDFNISDISDSSDDFDSGSILNDSQDSTMDINPASGLLMVGGIGGVDTEGNSYGSDSHLDSIMDSGMGDSFSGMGDSFSGMDDSFSGMDDSFCGMDDSFSGMDDSFCGMDDSFSDSFDSSDF